MCWESLGFLLNPWAWFSGCFMTSYKCPDWPGTSVHFQLKQGVRAWRGPSSTSLPLIFDIWVEWEKWHFRASLHRFGVFGLPTTELSGQRKTSSSAAIPVKCPRNFCLLFQIWWRLSPAICLQMRMLLVRKGFQSGFAPKYVYLCPKLGSNDSKDSHANGLEIFMSHLMWPRVTNIHSFQFYSFLSRTELWEDFPSHALCLHRPSHSNGNWSLPKQIFIRASGQIPQIMIKFHTDISTF